LIGLIRRALWWARKSFSRFFWWGCRGWWFCLGIILSRFLLLLSRCFLTSQPVRDGISQKSPFATDISAGKFQFFDDAVGGCWRDLQILGQFFQRQNVQGIKPENIVRSQIATDGPLAFLVVDIVNVIMRRDMMLVSYFVSVLIIFQIVADVCHFKSFV
jgi:hypothetical protein